MGVAARLRPSWAAYLAVAFGVTWTAWLVLPLLSLEARQAQKVWTGLGLGPGVAAVLLTRSSFIPERRVLASLVAALVWLAVVAAGLWAVRANDSVTLPGPGDGSVGWLEVVAAAGSASMAAFIAWRCVASDDPILASITRTRAPLGAWMFAVLLIPLLYAAGLAIEIGIFGSGVPLSPLNEAPLGSSALFITRGLLFTLFVVCIGEEPGWRGWLLPRVLERRGPLSASLFVGLVWGLWHIPLFIVGFNPGGAAGVLFQVLLTTIVGVYLTWLYLRSDGNLLLALVMHASLNITAKLLTATWSTAALSLALAVALGVAMWRLSRQKARGRGSDVPSPLAADGSETDPAAGEARM